MTETYLVTGTRCVYFEKRKQTPDLPVQAVSSGLRDKEDFKRKVRVAGEVSG